MGFASVDDGMGIFLFGVVWVSLQKSPGRSREKTTTN